MTGGYRFIGPRVASGDGVEIQTYDYGGHGPVIVVCHATGCCGPAYEPFITALTPGFRCVAFDFRGHGRSEAPVDGFMGWAGMADDVCAVVDHYSPEKPVLAVGHSLGGGSLVLAEATRPGTISAIWAFEPILFDGSLTDREPSSSTMSEAARRRRGTFADRSEAYERYSSRPPLGLLDDRSLRSYIEHGFRDTKDGVELCCHPELEARTFEQHQTGAAQAVMELDIDIAVAIGEPSSPVAQHLHALLQPSGGNSGGNHPVNAPAGRPSVIDYPDVTHFGPLEEPERLARDATAWFETRADAPQRG